MERFENKDILQVIEETRALIKEVKNITKSFKNLDMSNKNDIKYFNETSKNLINDENIIKISKQYLEAELINDPIINNYEFYYLSNE